MWLHNIQFNKCTAYKISMRPIRLRINLISSIKSNIFGSVVLKSNRSLCPHTFNYAIINNISISHCSTSTLQCLKFPTADCFYQILDYTKRHYRWSDYKVRLILLCKEAIWDNHQYLFAWQGPVQMLLRAT